MTMAVVRKSYHCHIMTEETQFYQISAPDLLSKTLPRGTPDGIKRKT